VFVTMVGQVTRGTNLIMTDFLLST